MLTDIEKKNLKDAIQSNKHEVYLVSVAEMDKIIASSSRGNNPSVQKSWQKMKSKLNAGASYYASIDDVVTLSKLAGDLGGIGAKVSVKIYGGKPHLILKGYPGLRKILVGTKYGIKNPKVISMGLGKAGAIGAAKQGGILTVVLLTVYRVADYFLTDEATLSQLIGTLATDVVKVGITTGASVAAAAGVAMMVGLSVFAIGPIVAVVVVGVLTSLILEEIDKKFGLTDKVIAGLDEMGRDITGYITEKKNQVQRSTAEVLGSAIDYAIESAVSVTVNWAQRQITGLIRPGLR